MLVSVIGARPQFIKAAVVSRALAEAGISEEIVHTGQHYDDHMSGQFLRQLGISKIAANLEAGSGNHAEQTARIMTGFDAFLAGRAERPSGVVVYGDTNSTVAAGLVAAKLGVPLIHVEAGLRSYNRAMPEEINRVVVDHLSQLLFCSSPIGVENLAKEGITRNVHDVGDVMLDAFQHFSKVVGEQGIAAAPEAGIKGPFVLVTIHRPNNTDNRDRMQAILEGLGRVGLPCIWPAHPRNQQCIAALNLPPTVHCIPPVGYLEMLSLLDACAAVVTDSGGLQKEAYWARRPCITVREETEWVETLEDGWNRLADPITNELASMLTNPPLGEWRTLYGDGHAARRISAVIAEALQGSR